MIVILLLVLAFISYSANAAVSRDSFKKHYLDSLRRLKAANTATVSGPAKLLAKLSTAIAPADRAPAFALANYVVVSVVTITDGPLRGTVYLAWLGLWIPLMTVAPTTSPSSGWRTRKSASGLDGEDGDDEDEEDLDDIEAQAGRLVDQANAAKKRADYETAARKFSAAAALYSPLASTSSPAALDACRLHEQAAQCLNHPSLASTPAAMRARLASLRAALTALDQAPPGLSIATLESRRASITDSIADLLARAGDVHGALAAYAALTRTSGTPAPLARRARVAALHARGGNVGDAHRAFVACARDAARDTEYQFRAAEFALDAAVTGLVAGQYRDLHIARTAVAAVIEGEWGIGREKAFLEALESANSIAAAARILDDWSAMLSGWREGMLRGWLSAQGR
ncbi:hypothetical protein BC828DRAFT_385275 [Blastocladiella britannica]|nr:hypothetical protein BC828DRAFT_385275 [Blastocladiella britannica]